MMTGFTRIIIVLSLLRQALGTTSTPPNQVLVGLALFLTLFVMSPVLDRAYVDAYKPFSDGTITMDQAMTRGVAPFKQFMLRQTRESDLRAVRTGLRKRRHERSRRRAALAAGAVVRDERAQDRFPDRLHHLHPVSHHRHGGGERADVDGDDDGVTHHHLIAVQADVVRAGGRLAVADRLARAELRLIASVFIASGIKR